MFNRWKDGNGKVSEIIKIKKRYFLKDKDGIWGDVNGYKSLKYLHSLLRESGFRMVIGSQDVL